ncbi:hypothetical protein [Paenibacillus arenilitoris]|uniref:Uncharacterized protein n=1 Tax=Paenibacillus arenilitoris TaxID=2772299 RepID=A0A927CJ81_9BACL|nr:hypothetical protein [Paenibacillus arenilitoris]MBD2869098.1 hypothetical protein [Paenibacillus arenilitoris]
MRLHRQSLILIGCLVMVSLVIVICVYVGSDKVPSQASIAKPTGTAQPEASAKPERNFNVSEFATDTSEPHVLWRQEQQSIYVHNLHLYYTSDGVDKQVMYEWTEPHAAHAWLNGEHLLIGEQLIEKGSREDGNHGAWMAVRIRQPKPVIIAPREKKFFGPQELLSVTAIEQPEWFVIKTLNGSSFSEHVFDLSRGEWESLNRNTMGGVPGDVPGKIPDKVEGLQVITDAQVFQLSDGTTAYSFVDNDGGLIYSKAPHYLVWRYAGYELIDMKLMAFMEEPPQLLGRFRSQDGDEVASFVGGNFDTILQGEPRLWEEDWQALNAYTFTHRSPEKLEIIQYASGDSTETGTAPPRYKQYPLDGATWKSSQGSLLEYEMDGETKYISWYDLLHTENADPKTLWSAPLDNADFKQEERPPYDPDWVSHQVLAWDFEQMNTNAPVPEELERAVNEAHLDSDYGFAKTYRKFGSRWFALVDEHLYEYKDGSLTAIGDLPITVSVTVGEGFSGRGARDFTRVNDGWIVADTEGSRVLKLNDKLEIVKRLEIPAPYRITVEGGMLHIASTAYRYTTDEELQLMNAEPQPFQTATAVNMASYDHFRPQEWYRDKVSGLTWYYLDGWLYQYAEAKREYRTFYIGYNENARAQTHIVPYEDEVLVLLDRRLERFDRQGKWMSTLAYPRSKPDGIYDHTTQGENTLIVDEAADLLYLVQGYRILALDWKRNEVKTVFRQNYADIGKPVKFNGSLYFLLRSNENDRYKLLQEGLKAGQRMYTEIVALDLQSLSVSRKVTPGYYETMELSEGSGDPPAFTLRRYN